MFIEAKDDGSGSDNWTTMRLKMLYQLTDKNTCTVLEVVVFNVAFYLNYLNNLLLTIYIKQTSSFKTYAILNHLSI